MPNAVLNDTTLAAIVRDEEINPAHGIEVWLRATLPHVGRAVVVDTGSVDRTREILESLKGEFAHLEVYDGRFDDFASSRDFSLSKVRTRRALILDADELLMPEEYGNLNMYVAGNPARGYDFTFKLIYPDGCILNTVWDQQIVRLFDVEGAQFSNSRQGGFCESVDLPNQEKAKFPFVPVEVAIIKHFLPSQEALSKKKMLWYKQGDLRRHQPLEHANTYGWKEPNGGRNFFYSQENLANARKLFPRL